MLKKSLGQNFLTDHNIAKKIIKLIPNVSNINLVEIGPGKGFLTDHLIKLNPKRLIIIEKDKELYLELKEKYNNFKNIEIFNEDILKSQIINNLSKPKIITSNLPYNISIKIILNLLIKIEEYKSLHFMIQKEVAEKFVYKNNLKSNRLNLLAYLISDYKKEFDVSPNVFFPKPKVMSSVVTFRPNLKTNININNFQEFTKILFSTKRKKISNNLIRNDQYKKILKKSNELNFNLSMRPEELKFNEIIELFKFLHN